jgi:hypothetical protein
MKPSAPTKSMSLTPQTLRARIGEICDELQAFITNHGNEPLRKLWPDWNTRFRELADQAEERPEVAISLIGGTGAGKSTLLNALIGAKLLPVSSSRACTAAVCEVSYTDGSYSARIEFVSRAAWLDEVGQPLQDWRDSRSETIGDEAGDKPEEIPQSVRDKLQAVYRLPKEVDFHALEIAKLVEPPEIKEALDLGLAEIASADLADFRKLVAQYLDAKHPYWPIIKTVSVRGPFTPLQDGAKLIDLPGVNDPNVAREKVTLNHLKTCRFVWIVFNMRRTLTSDVVAIMKTDDFLRRLVMDGRANSLTFVGSHSDELGDLGEAAQQFGLNEDAAKIDIIQARNEEVRKELPDQLSQLAHDFGEEAREDKQTVRKLATTLRASKVFPVSALEYQRFRKLARTESRGITNEDETGIPSLQHHLHQIGASYGVTAHCQSIDRRLRLILSEIEREIRSQKAAIKNRAQVSERGRKEMREAVVASREFLDGKLDDACERLVQDLEASQALLAERVKRAVERARFELNQTIGRWGRIHHMTIRAVCRNEGVYVGTTGRNDFPADLSKPILDGIAFAWSDFFGEHLQLCLKKWTDHLLRQADAYRGQLANSLAVVPEASPSLIAGLDGVFDTTEKVLHEIVAQANNQMEGRIQVVQRSLYESVTAQVGANMRPAFLEAAQESGSGMKRRMVDILARHASGISQVMFDDARDAILSGLRGLNDWLAREYEKMAEAVRRNAALAAENLVASGERLSTEKIAAEQQLLNELAGLLKGCHVATES